MNFTIRNIDNGSITTYSPKQMQALARAMAKDAKQKLLSYHVEFTSAGNARVVAILDAGHGTTVQHTCAI